MIGGAGGGGSGATTALITQVQFMNLNGRVGGSEGSAGMQAFADGFGEIFCVLGLCCSLSVADSMSMSIGMYAGCCWVLARKLAITPGDGALDALE